ncbi:hypothetical protein [Clostridium sp. HBUAS56017]|uniref:hypothetical protein n=1 Tax=Clostridium sp. HBUAS56017 TaxID=2571128 RepID=UPI00163D83EE|nr:hypothetical protein [Clostridium sp. HBUAS56017]
MKSYLGAIWIGTLFIPLCIGGIGIYRNNADLIMLGILLIAAVSGIPAIVLPKLANKNK